MATAVMRQFAGYTIAVIMEMPYCHFVKLYAMAETADTLTAYTILQGNAALHDKKIIDQLAYVAESKYVQPKIVFPKEDRG